MVVSRKGIHEAQQLMTRDIVNEVAYSGQQEVGLQACFIQVGEINAHSPFSFAFPDPDCVGQPLWVSDFVKEASL